MATNLFAVTGDAVARVREEEDGWAVSLALEGSGARCVAVDPGRARTIYVGAGGSGVWRSEDAGESWEKTALRQSAVFSIAVGSDGALYAGCEPSMLFRSSDGEEWEELEALRRLPSAPTWSFPPRPWTSHVRAIAPSPHDPSLLLVGIELGGVMLSDDGGETWHDHRSGAQRDAHAIAWHADVHGRAYEAGGGGAAWSFDGGWTWEPADAGRDRHYTWALAVDPVDPDRWYVSASPGPHSAHRVGHADARLYRWGGGCWEELTGGLPDPLDAMPYALHVGDGRLFAGLADGGIYSSADSGESWNRLSLRGDRLRSILALTSIRLG
ncbi:MAG: hypothetical protein M3312_07555 [Actinomycetota bacterium]|nr:hypothetical protein [Actinomycetota bacterium]